MAWEADEATVACLGCGQAMATPRGRTMVCSSRCAKRQWRARRRRERRQVCAGCRLDFVPSRSDARFCGAACKQTTYRQRKAAKAAARQASIDLAHALIG
jgi:hypothetical protein